MKLKKIISVVSAFAMAASMFTVASAASLGGKPTVTASLDSYNKVNDTAAFAYVNVVMDVSAAEELEVYSSEFDFGSMSNVTKGNGITTMGITMTAPTGFTYVPSMSTIPSYASVNTSATSISIAPISAPENYVIDEVITLKLAYAVTNLDASSSISITTASLDGKNSAESAVWSYHTSKSNIDVTGCTIPSYNEWSTPVTPDPVAALSIEVAEGYDKDAGYVWGLDITKAADTAINGFKAEFTTGTESTERNLDAKNVGLLNNFVAEGTGATRVWVGLKTAKEVANATFTVTDAANTTVSDSWK